MQRFSMDLRFLAGRTIHLTCDPVDEKAYRRLLPDCFGMPDHPRVLVSVTSFGEVEPRPYTPYCEAAVLVAARLGLMEGWHCLAMPVTSRVALWAGRLVGFPKELAEVTLTEEGGTFSGVARSAVPLLELRLTDPQPTEECLLDIPTYHRGVPFLQLQRWTRGVWVTATSLDMLAPYSAVGQTGSVRISAGPTQPWADLLPDEAPGQHAVWRTEAVLRHGRVAGHVIEAGDVREHEVTMAG